jgi:hypothetical protein
LTATDSSPARPRVSTPDTCAAFFHGIFPACNRKSDENSEESRSSSENQTESPAAEAEEKKSHSETDQLTNRSSTRRAQESAGERRDYKARRRLALSGRGSCKKRTFALGLRYLLKKNASLSRRVCASGRRSLCARPFKGQH